MQPIAKQVEEYLNFCLYNRNMTQQTMSSKSAVLFQFMKAVEVQDMQDFTNEKFNQWVEVQLKSGTVSSRTINTRASHVISMSKWLKDMGYDIPLKFSLVYKLKEEPPRRNFFTREQIEKAKEYADAFSWLLISLAFDSGLRISELRNLRLENINGRQMRIVGKGRKAGQLFMSEETRERLDKWIEHNDIDDYLWPSPAYEDGRPYSLDEMRYHMRKPFKRAGLEGFYPHSLRHSFGTELQTNGAPIDVTQKLMRHSSVATTEKYLHGLDNRLEDEYDKYKNGGKKEELIESKMDRFKQLTRDMPLEHRRIIESYAGA